MADARKIIVYIATSADGYIARPDGDVEWLNRHPQKADYGMTEFYAGIDTILWGRGTYDWLLEYARKQGTDPGAMFDRSRTNYIFSHQPPATAVPGTTFVTDSVPEFAGRLRATPGKNIWMMGGGNLIASFLDAGAIDQFDIHIIPTLIGEGIPLIAPRHRDIPLRLLASQSYSDGVVRVQYEVIKAA